MKYLGVYINDELNWKTHINFVCSKLKQANGALSKLRHFVSEKILLSLYYSLFHSHMSYAALIWGQRENIHIRRILTLQKQAFLKPGLLKLPKVSSVLFGNNSFRY